MPLIFSVLTCCATLGGGVFALRCRSRLHLMLGFTGGVLLGVVAFDVLPEIMRGSADSGVAPERFMGALVLGFLLLHSFEKLIIEHQAGHNDKHPVVGRVAAFSLAMHSFFDGVGIGLGFQVSQAVGILVAIAVISHDFADGLNTVNLTLLHRNSSATAWRMLMLDALAPTLGVFSTLLFHPKRVVLLGYLAFLTGFLLYISASEILPEAHRDHPSRAALLMTVAGVSFIFAITRWI